jgi:hypothetical protein
MVASVPVGIGSHVSSSVYVLLGSLQEDVGLDASLSSLKALCEGGRCLHSSSNDQNISLEGGAVQIDSG